MPYNAYFIVNTKYDELIRPDHLNPDHVRYESHRVWAVEGKLREGKKHIYERRLLHLDEDLQAIVQGELYDGRGELWRVQEVHTANFYQVPACLSVAEPVYDIQSPGSYLAVALPDEVKPSNLNGDGLDLTCFTPERIIATPTINRAPPRTPGCFGY